MEQRLDLCANCGRWREEHYGSGGIWVADRWQQPCLEYHGASPTPDRAKRKDEELAAVRAGREPSYGD